MKLVGLDKRVPKLKSQNGGRILESQTMLCLSSSTLFFVLLRRGLHPKILNKMQYKILSQVKKNKMEKV